MVFSISLKLKSDQRNIKVAKIIVPPTEKSIKKEAEHPKKTNNIFGAAQSKPVQSKSGHSKEVKNDSSSKDAKMKEEKSSPKKQSPKKNQPPAKQSKSSIASFFGSKPTTSNAAKPSAKSVAEATFKIESVQIKDEPIDITPNEPQITQKRPFSNTSGEFTETISVSKKLTI